MKTTGKFFGLIALGAVLLTGCWEDKPCVTGSGTTQSYNFEVTEFNEVSLSGPMDLLLKDDAQHAVTLVAEPEIYAIIDFNIYGKRVDIDIENGISCFQTGHGILVQATAPVMKKIDIAGESEIRSDGDIDEEELEIKVAGSADVMLSGRAAYQKIDVSGSIKVSNYELVSETVDIDISGSGTVEVYAEKELNIRVSGDATVRYRGNPIINQNVSGKLQLIDAN